LNNYRIVYFSGTGCTALVADMLAKALRERGCDSVSKRITAETGGSAAASESMAAGSVGSVATSESIATDPEGITSETADVDTAASSERLNNPNTLILLFPVYCFTAPAPVLRWFDGLRRADGIPAAVISVSGGGEIFPNRASRVSAIKLLKLKGYDVFFEDTVVMPSNYFVATPEPMDAMLLQVLPEKTGAIADGIMAGALKRSGPFFLDKFFARIGKSLIRHTKSWGRKIVVSDGCDGCGLCAAKCPSVNISMGDSRPAFSDKCCMCLGCFYACPKDALTPRTAKSIIVKSFDLKELEEKAFASVRSDVSQIRAGLIWDGVKKYLSDF